jgi:hypothetical protein
MLRQNSLRRLRGPPDRALAAQSLGFCKVWRAQSTHPFVEGSFALASSQTMPGPSSSSTLCFSMTAAMRSGGGHFVNGIGATLHRHADLGEESSVSVAGSYTARTLPRVLPTLRKPCGTFPRMYRRSGGGRDHIFLPVFIPPINLVVAFENPESLLRAEGMQKEGPPTPGTPVTSTSE